MSENVYTLSKLAWLSRCLFPNDFRDELIRMGADKVTAGEIARLSRDRNGKGRNILEIYQIVIGCEEHVRIIECYCVYWFKRNGHLMRKEEPTTEKPVLADCYNTPQTYLVQPDKVDYEIPHSTPIKTINEGRFKTYRTCSEQGVCGLTVGQMNREQAERFAKYNSLKLITEEEQEKLS